MRPSKASKKSYESLPPCDVSSNCGHLTLGSTLIVEFNFGALFCAALSTIFSIISACRFSTSASSACLKCFSNISLASASSSACFANLVSSSASCILSAEPACEPDSCNADPGMPGEALRGGVLMACCSGLCLCGLGVGTCPRRYCFVSIGPSRPLCVSKLSSVLTLRFSAGASPSSASMR